jgi:predicted O-methyltransferase YrrM
MKLHQSTVMNNIDKFPGATQIDGVNRRPRDNTDMLQLWQVCKYFQPSSILEIGFSAGQTFGLFLDATADNTKYVAVDFDFKRNQSIFDDIFKDHPKKNNIQFINVDSRNLELTEKFDFIHIDANHDYEFVLNDLKKCLPLMHEKTILSMDDTLDEGVERVIKEYLLGQHEFIPFLAGNKQILFRHKENIVTTFVNNDLRTNIDEFVVFDNWNYNGFTITKMHIPNFIENNQSIFFQALKTYDI